MGLLACTAHVNVATVLAKLAATVELIEFDAHLLFLLAWGEGVAPPSHTTPCFLSWAVGQLDIVWSRH